MLTQLENASNVYDKVIHILIRITPLKFLLWIIPNLHKSAKFHRFLDTRTIPFPLLPDQICDLVLEVSFDNIRYDPQGHKYRTKRPSHAFVLEAMSHAHVAIIPRGQKYGNQVNYDLRYPDDLNAGYHTPVVVLNMTGRNRPAKIRSYVPTQDGNPPQSKNDHTGKAKPDDANPCKLAPGQSGFCPIIVNLCDFDADPAIPGQGFYLGKQATFRIQFRAGL